MFEEYIETIRNQNGELSCSSINTYVEGLAKEECIDIINRFGGEDLCFKTFNTCYLFEDCQEGSPIQDIDHYVNKGIVKKILYRYTK